MKTEPEIIAAHDRLNAILLGEVPPIFDEDEIDLLKVAHDVLCWVLEHSHNQSFQHNLDAIDEELAELGFVLKRIEPSTNAEEQEPAAGAESTDAASTPNGSEGGK